LSLDRHIFFYLNKLATAGDIILHKNTRCFAERRLVGEEERLKAARSQERESVYYAFFASKMMQKKEDNK
jgi:hypothetical protein